MAHLDPNKTSKLDVLLGKTVDRRQGRRAGAGSRDPGRAGSSRDAPGRQVRTAIDASSPSPASTRHRRKSRRRWRRPSLHRSLHGDRPGRLQRHRHADGVEQAAVRDLDRRQVDRADDAAARAIQLPPRRAQDHVRELNAEHQQDGGRLDHRRSPTTKLIKRSTRRLTPRSPRLEAARRQLMWQVFVAAGSHC